MAYGLVSCVYIHTYSKHLQSISTATYNSNIYTYFNYNNNYKIRFSFLSVFFLFLDFFVHHVTYAQCKKTFAYATAATCDGHTGRRGRVEGGRV